MDTHTRTQLLSWLLQRAAHVRAILEVFTTLCDTKTCAVWGPWKGVSSASSSFQSDSGQWCRSKHRLRVWPSGSSCRNGRGVLPTNCTTRWAFADTPIRRKNAKESILIPNNHLHIKATPCFLVPCNLFCICSDPIEFLLDSESAPTPCLAWQSSTPRVVSHGQKKSPGGHRSHQWHDIILGKKNYFKRRQEAGYASFKSCWKYLGRRTPHKRLY